MLCLLQVLTSRIVNSLDKHYLQSAFHCGELLSNLTNDFLDYVAINQHGFLLRISSCQLKKVLNDAIDMMRMQAQNKGLELNLVWVWGPDVPQEYFIDANRLKQVLLQLIGTALRFTMQGSITVRCTSINNASCRIEVIDTGVLNAQDVDRLQRETKNGFYRDTRYVSPAGICFGLTIANLLVKELGPNETGLQIKSEAGVGSTFYFILQSNQDQENNLSDSDSDPGADVQNNDKQESQIFFPKTNEHHSMESLMDKRSSIK